MDDTLDPGTVECTLYKEFDNLVYLLLLFHDRCLWRTYSLYLLQFNLIWLRTVTTVGSSAFQLYHVHYANVIKNTEVRKVWTTQVVDNTDSSITIPKCNQRTSQEFKIILLEVFKGSLQDI